MRLPHRFGVILAAAIVLAFAGMSQAQIGHRRVTYYTFPAPVVTTPGVTYHPPGVTYAPIYPYYNPYVAPYPGYGILPPPLATYNYLYGNTYDPAYRTHDARDYNEPPARKRNSLYPAVPFEKSDRIADIRRVRFEITVPTEDAIVLVDGVQMKQTGLNRVFVTPPMDEDRLYSSTFEVTWSVGEGKTNSIRRTFEFVAGETVRYTFK
jgi:uncharacterized protein (TIGR03000 family)